MHSNSITQHKSAASCIEKDIRGICKRTRDATVVNDAENKVRQYIVIKRTPSHASRNATVRQRELCAQLQFAKSIIGKYHRLRISSYQSEVRTPINIEIGGDHQSLGHIGRTGQTDLLPYREIAAGVAAIN